MHAELGRAVDLYGEVQIALRSPTALRNEDLLEKIRAKLLLAKSIMATAQTHLVEIESQLVEAQVAEGENNRRNLTASSVPVAIEKLSATTKQSRAAIAEVARTQRQ
ncbi:hypothetical protein A2335_00125 [Candidatus Peregrinibacteria bacterium RIFOXYB2_FULL_32_7]|nr:MAG: hypothetical protein A2335_00125 [Candidatus Peregrinibacteria bacterium RIFOXYB2_FULL_32_7]